MSNNDEYCTPPEHVELARELMGSIDLDPATNPLAQEYIKAKQWYVKENNGLALPWHGNIWLNPPYSYPLVEQFTTKAIEHISKEPSSQAVVLVNACTDAKWFQQLMDYPCCFVRGRISFYLNGKKINGNRNGQAFFYLGEREVEFRHLFKDLGRIVTFAC